jgi:hypothetical protein
MRNFFLLFFLLYSLSSLSQSFPATPVVPEIESPKTKDRDIKIESKSHFPVEIDLSKEEPTPAFVPSEGINAVKHTNSFQENPHYNTTTTPEENRKYFEDLDNKKKKEKIVTGLVTFFSGASIAFLIIFLNKKFTIKRR